MWCSGICISFFSLSLSLSFSVPVLFTQHSQSHIHRESIGMLCLFGRYTPGKLLGRFPHLLTQKAAWLGKAAAVWKKKKKKRKKGNPVETAIWTHLLLLSYWGDGEWLIELRLGEYLPCQQNLGICLPTKRDQIAHCSFRCSPIRCSSSPCHNKHSCHYMLNGTFISTGVDLLHLQLQIHTQLSLVINIALCQRGRWMNTFTQSNRLQQS